jgi:hypothetical protein
MIISDPATPPSKGGEIIVISYQDIKVPHLGDLGG